VGREQEIEQLHSAYDLAVGGRGLMAFVAGEAGIGKTTLVEDFLGDLRARGEAHTLGRGRCSERLAGSEAYLPIIEALETLLHGEGSEAASRMMRRVAPTWYAQVAPPDPEDSSYQRIVAELRTASQERMKRELAAFFQKMSQPRPLVLFLDDLHWADVSTVDLLAYIGTRLESMRLLVVGVYRPADLLLAEHPLVPVRLEMQGHDLARALGVEQADFEERMEELDRLHGLVRLSGDRELPDSTLTLRYGFVHALCQNALYSSLTATRKAALSAAVAEALLVFYGERASEAASELALLFEAARDLARAWEHLEEAVRIFERDVWNRWRYNIRLQAERASYWISRGDLKQAAAYAAASLEQSKVTLSRKHWAWAHKLFGDIAVLEDRVPEARKEYEQALSILECHSCPVIEWRILLAAAEAADRLHDTSSADSLRARARHVIESLAESIAEPSLRQRFLSAQPIRS